MIGYDLPDMSALAALGPTALRLVCTYVEITPGHVTYMYSTTMPCDSSYIVSIDATVCT